VPHVAPERPLVYPDVSHIVLIGLMGAGKSTVGEALANQVGWRFIDTDVEIEAVTGRTVRELWEQGGEEAYRPLEAQVVVDALERTDPSVLAAPGGVVNHEAASAAIGAAEVVAVYLRASVATLLERVGRNPGHRPLLGDQPEGVVAQLFAQRDRAYEDLADVIVETDELRLHEMARAVFDSLVGVAIRAARAR